MKLQSSANINSNKIQKVDRKHAYLFGLYELTMKLQSSANINSNKMQKVDRKHAYLFGLYG